MKRTPQPTGPDLLSRIIDRRGLLKQDAAEAAGISPVLLSQILHRRRAPTLVQALAIADAFGVPPRAWVV